jgi:hypothetical protein
MSRPIGEISAVFDPAVGLPRLLMFLKPKKKLLIYFMMPLAFEDAEKEADPPEGCVS